MSALFGRVVLSLAVLASIGCTSSTQSSDPTAGGAADNNGGTNAAGGANATGGQPGNGGRLAATGGAPVTGGFPNNSGGAGGSSGSGGMTTMGGSVTGGDRGGTTMGLGGVNPSGGSTAPGGNAATGGTIATGGSTASTGGNAASGGITGAGGSAATGGTIATGGNTASSGTTADPFVLAWEDNFDSFDSSLWQLMTHTWDGNLAQFSTQNTKVAAGILSISLTSEAGDAAKPYRGVEMRSTKTLTYGKFSARIRFAKGPGVVSGLVSIYTPWPAGDWNEIDIEHLGKSPTAVQLNCMYYAGTPIANPTTSVTPTQDPLVSSLGFDAEAGFHQYDVEWTPANVKFIVDGVIVRTWNAQIAKMKLPQNILFTIWASSSADWAGAISSAAIPTTADIDWIRVYALKN